MDIILLFASFATLWVGAGISINAVEKVSKKLKISSFLISFFALGLLTSTSEISVAYFSLIDNTPSISVGNLIGATTVLMLFAVPLLAIINGEISFDKKVEPLNFPLVYLVTCFPVLLIIFDQKLSKIDGAILLFSILILFLTISSKKTLLEKIEDAFDHQAVNVLMEVLRILVGVLFIVFSCRYIVDTLVAYANKLAVSPFLIGLLLLSFGTNLPELTILLKSLISRKKTIAFGDYIGSAVINTLVLAVLGLVSSDAITFDSGVKYSLLILPVGALLLLLFSKDKRLKRSEGIVLVMLFVLFGVLEVL